MERSTSKDFDNRWLTFFSDGSSVGREHDADSFILLALDLLIPAQSHKPEKLLRRELEEPKSTVEVVLLKQAYKVHAIAWKWRYYLGPDEQYLRLASPATLRHDRLLFVRT